MGVEKSRLLPMVENNKNIAVVFVHGLNGDPVNTWRKDHLTKTLPELLGYDNELKAFDFYSYGYKTGFTARQYDFSAVAEILFSDIQAQLPTRDIVFVAHSMGGLVIQQYIVNRFEQYDSENLKRIKGIVYLSVPFQGAGLARVLPKLIINKQIRSLRKQNPLLVQLEDKWHKYFFRGGVESLPIELRHKIPQIAFHGAQDLVVSEASASPLHLDATVYKVDENHTSICKVDKDSTIYKHIKKFLLEIALSSTKVNSMILYVHGYEKQTYEYQPDVELDWTQYFEVSSSPRILPSTKIWGDILAPQLDLATSLWSQEWVKKGGRIRLYSKLSLPGGVLIGNRFPRTKGAIVEVEHYKQIWSSDKIDKEYKIVPKRSPGNATGSTRAIMILSVTNNIENAVKQHLEQNNIDYRVIVNILPPNGPGHMNIENAEQAVAYAFGVKNVADELRSQDIQEIFLFLNCPFSVAVFVGHYLTVMCPIHIFDFANPGYVPSCRI